MFAPSSYQQKSVVQPKLTIGQPGDKYEQEADTMADQVMRMPQSESPIQRQCEDCEEESLQMKPLANSISPILQKQSAEGSSPQVSSNLSSQLNHSKGGGKNLPNSTNQFMSNAFETDFSAVRIHTDSNAIQMNRSLNARAFTNGNDVYFNKGEYKPNSGKGKHLLAHELTHTIQQSGSSTIQRAPAKAKPKSKPPKTKADDIHDFFPKPNACACIVHIHNDERNSKAVARLLNDKCNYSLIDLKDSKASARGLNKSLKILNEKGKSEKKKDPNEIFSPEVIKTCNNPVERAKLDKKGFATHEVCRLFEDIAIGSNNFSIPVVALHNNTILKPKTKKAALSESTNIYRWTQSKAIDKTVIEDPANPDRVVWTSNPMDYKKLRIAGGVNTALAKDDFKGDTDLSTLFNYLPEIATDLGDDDIQRIAKSWGIDPDALKKFVQQKITEQIRYINIETEHNRNKYEQNLAEVNLEFVHDVLSKLGLWCCDKALTMDVLKKDLTEIKKPVKKKKKKKPAKKPVKKKTP